MHHRPIPNFVGAAIIGFIAITSSFSQAQFGPQAHVAQQTTIVELQGVVDYSKTGMGGWTAATNGLQMQPHDWLRTGTNSRVALRWSDQSILSFGGLTEIEVLPPESPGAESGLHLVRGIVSFFHRDEPGHFHVLTHGAVAGVEGTDFVLSGSDSNVTRLWVIDGMVQFGNGQTTILVTNGEQAVIQPGSAPTKSAGFIANNVLQWCFYYPGVIDATELPLTPAERQALSNSLALYSAGDLQGALANYPAGRQPASDAERVYYAGLLLSVGQIDSADEVLAPLSGPGSPDRIQRLASALQELISAVNRQPAPSVGTPTLASEFLVASYYEQSRAAGDTSLKPALELARQSVAMSPGFGFGWERVAELEFSFGRTKQAMDALDKSLNLAPRNAQAVALRGFLLAANNRTAEARQWFEKALSLDSSLGNGWLGLGLCKIRKGDAAGGREDLLVAAALEPQRSVIRSYLGKAYANAGDQRRAAKELELAKVIDPNDPTAWLYSALLNQERSRINEGIEELEESQELGENRRVFRSQFLLDQDAAVRSVNLAAMYRDAGMFDVSLQEAARAVIDDYGNYSAHLFLANSYAELLDPNDINLRYETPEVAEYLVANLLAPSGAGTLSTTISQQEYSKFFEQDGFGMASSSEYLSRGAWTEDGAQYGNFGNFSYDFEAYYRSDPGQWVNNDIEEQELSLLAKQQVTPADSVSLNVLQYESHKGDLAEYYDPGQSNPHFSDSERQSPTIGLGYHHEWGPGMHTLIYVTRLEDNFYLANAAQQTYAAFYPLGFVVPVAIDGVNMNESYGDQLAIYSGEVQQIAEQVGHTTVLGGRIQYGNFHTESQQNLPSTLGALFPPEPEPAAQQDVSSRFERFSAYGYHQWQIFEPLELIGGLAYDRIIFPANFLEAPISAESKSVEQFSPKAGLVWNTADHSTIRFAYTKSLSGASIDQSIQIEPAQVAGFVQSFRSIIPESVVGGTPGSRFETFDAALEQKFPSRTYLILSGEILKSREASTTGTFAVVPTSTFAVPSDLTEDLDYQEQTVQLNVNQLFGREWSLGAKYRLSQAVLQEDFTELPETLRVSSFNPSQYLVANLQQADFTVLYNHPSGFYATGEADWYGQSNQGYTPGEPGDQFWQFNAYAGYRSPRRRVEAQFGLLNIANQGYNLNPLNLYNQMPLRRTIDIRLNVSF